MQYSPQIETASYHRKRLGWSRWRLDETSINGKGQWRYLDRAVDPTAQTVALLRTEQRDRDAALRCLTKVIRRHGMPETLTIEAKASANRAYNEAHGTTIAIRQVRSRKKMVEQDHRAVKCLTSPRLGCKSL